MKAIIAFSIPLLSGLGAMFTMYENTGLPTHWKIVLAACGCLSLVAGFSGLSSFLSRSYADHMDAQDVTQGAPQVVPAAVTAVAEPAKPISGPENPSPT